MQAVEAQIFIRVSLVAHYLPSTSVYAYCITAVEKFAVCEN